MTDAPSSIALRPRRTGQSQLLEQLLHPVPFAFAASMFANFLVDLHGDDHLFMIGSFNLHGADIATAFCAIALLVSLPRMGRINALKMCVFVFGAVAVFTLLRGVMSDLFRAFYVFRTRAVTLAFLLYVAFSGRKLYPITKIEPSSYFSLAFMYAFSSCGRSSARPCSCLMTRPRIWIGNGWNRAP